MFGVLERGEAMEFVVDGSADCLAEYLTAEGIHEDVVAKIIDNRISCALFLDLGEEDLKDLATMIGDRIALRNVLGKARKVHNNYYVFHYFILLQCKDQPERPEPLQQPCVPRSQATSTSCSRWHHSFSIPDLHSFSPFVKDAIDNGIVTGRAKREIIQVLRTYITAFTMYPAPEQYTTVCRKLVEKYPLLSDDTDEQCNFVS